MLAIKSEKILFVSNPKTGTTKVQDILLNNFRKEQLNKVFIEDSSKFIKLNEHDNIEIIKNKIDKIWDDYKSFVFVRSPYEKAISAYHFYLNGKPITRKDNKRKFQVYINIYTARILPFGLWILIKPLKLNYKYVLDGNDVISVNHLGNNDSLLSDLSKLFKMFKLNIDIDDHSKLNISTYSKTKNFFKNNIVKFLFDYKYQKDIILYEKLKKYTITDNLKNKRIKDL